MEYGRGEDGKGLGEVCGRGIAGLGRGAGVVYCCWCHLFLMLSLALDV